MPVASVRRGARFAIPALCALMWTVAGRLALSAQDLASPAADQEPTPELVVLTPAQEARAHALEGELRCPVCRSQSIRQSRSFMAEDMKHRIRELIAEGRTDEEIRAFFVERYGPWILLEPPRRGFHLAAWLLPAGAVLAGAVGVILAARRWARLAPPRTDVEPPSESPYLSRLERELEETE